MNIININHLLNQYIADVAVMNIKLHNIHWNAIGQEFMSLHKYTEEIYNHFFKSYDEFAEVLKIKRQPVNASMKEYVKITTIQELTDRELSITEALTIMYEDLGMLRKTVNSLREISHSEGDITCTLLAEDEISFLDKQMWLIYSSLK
jgi:starvation-inducible DNA-binding protein